MKKRTFFNLFLVLLAFFLVYVLITSIEEPIAFKAEKEKRERAVVDRLMDIRKAQEAFRGVTGGFAPDFDSMRLVLNRDSFLVIRIIGDPDDPNFTGEISRDSTLIPARDSIIAMGLVLDSIEYVPFGQGSTFEMASDTMTYQQTLVNVVQVGVKRSEFMGPYKSKRFKKYDNSYDPSKVIKFGDLNKPTLAGNWEN